MFGEFAYEKFMMRFAFLVAFLAFIGVLIYASFTELSMEYPTKNVPVEIGSTLGAPDIGLTKEQNPLESAHRSDSELKNWINTVVSEALFFRPDNFNQVLNNVRPYFSEKGFQEYRQYLANSRIQETLTQKRYKMSAFAEDPPLLMSNQPVRGVYKWLYQVPVTITFLPAYTNNLVQTKTDMVTRQATLRLQITRAKVGNDVNAIQIESWRVSARK